MRVKLSAIIDNVGVYMGSIRVHGAKVISVFMLAVLVVSAVAPEGTTLAKGTRSAALANQDKTVTAREVSNALAAASGVLESSDQTKTSSDSDSAIVATAAGASIGHT